MQALKKIFPACLLTFTFHATAAENWQPLFNAKDLAGWVQHGGKATYTIEGNEIVGTSAPETPNTFLCTAKTYGDFILEYDFKVDERLNSGVQIRSECFDTEKEVTWKGKTIKIAAGRVHGYQIEIDPEVKKDRWWSAGIYDEGRRGWLFPADGNKEQAAKFTELGRKIFKRGDWNHVRAEVIGDSFKTWLNGTPCADIHDSMTPRGFIALQVHNIGKEKDKLGTQVRWRNLRIAEIAAPVNVLTAEEKAAGWRLLWDGKTPEGWRSAKSESFPTKGWHIHDGMLTVDENKGEESAAGGDIITRERFSSFELVADFKITPVANSGIKYFVQPNLDPITGAGAKAATGSAIGCEFQILDDERHPDAKLGKDGDRTLGSLYDLMTASADKKPSPIGEWNTARIVVRGKHVEHWLNSAKILEYERGSEDFRKRVAASKYKNIAGFGEWADGHILLQEHGSEVSYRNVKLRVLTEN
ncbi:MAG: DUF1080 domain-containing protein [Verrucomicrobia bacterium]|nr:MAG: DUF1080 domain-containing protein [Verrucomicrobiota bacterium]